MTQNERSIS